MQITGNKFTDQINYVVLSILQIHAVEKIFQTFHVPIEDEGKVGPDNFGFLKNSLNFIWWQLCYFVSVVNLHDGPSRRAKGPLCRRIISHYENPFFNGKVTAAHILCNSVKGDLSVITLELTTALNARACWPRFPWNTSLSKVFHFKSIYLWEFRLITALVTFFSQTDKNAYLTTVTVMFVL